MTDNPDEFLAESAGDFSAGFKFGTPGATITGVITRTPNVVETDDLGGGRSKKLVVDVDDGNTTWAIWLPANKGITRAVSKAVTASGAAGLAAGGKLTVTYTGDGEPSQPGYNPPKLFTAEYAQPAATVDPSDF